MEYKISEMEENQRYDRFLRKYFKQYPSIKLSDIYHMIRKWLIKVNWKKWKDNYRLLLNDNVYIPDDILWKLNKTKEWKLASFPIKKIKDMIIFEDENYIIFNKPAWVTIHEWNKHMEDLTMNSFLEKYVKYMWYNTSDTFKPAFCFRLDKDTSWILIAWKRYDSLKHLNELIRLHKTEKYYLAVVKWLAKNKTIEVPLEKVYDKKFGKAKVIVSENWDYAKSIVKVLKTKDDQNLGKISLIQVQLFTWRMHQIRVHVSHNKWPIIWDIMYADPVINRLSKKIYKITRQLLHSYKYNFTYDWKKYNITADIPEEFNNIMK